MGRWLPGARSRLERAALELFLEQGFAETTVPQIAERAGLTTRTFFRHFADKRAVLFGVEEEFPTLVEHLMAEAPPSLDPMTALVEALRSAIATRFDELFDYLQARRAVIETDEGLRERELRKVSILSEAIKRAFIDRGVDEVTSALAAHTAVSIFSVALDRWLDQRRPERALSDFLDEALGAFQRFTRIPTSR
jgi:AcrR family transcriptional regulator